MIRYFILAAGMGRRARPLSLFKPKPLFPLKGVPLVRHLLDQMCDLHLSSGFINLHHFAAMIRKETSDYSGISYLEEEQLSGSRILNSVHSIIDDPLLVINGDIYARIPFPELQKKLDRTQADGVLMVRRSERRDCPVIAVNGDRFVGRQTWAKPGDLMYTGVALLSRTVIQAIEKENFFDGLTTSDFDIRIHVYDGMWLDVGEAALYYSANCEFKRSQGDLSPNSLSENVTMDPSADVNDSIIWENSTISGSCTLSQCMVMPGMTLNGVTFHRKIISNEGVVQF